MKSNNVIEKIKDVLNLNEEVKLEQTKLENGTVIEAESFEEGKEVFIVSDEEKIAMPVGEYILEDTRLLVVEEEGVIARYVIRWQCNTLVFGAYWRQVLR